MARHTVKLYGLSTCSHCRSVKKMFDLYDIDYEYVQVDDFEGKERKKILEEVRALNPRCSFPTIRIDTGTIIVGCKEKEIKNALGITK